MNDHLFKKMIQGFAVRYSHSCPGLEAEDLLQDAFVALFQSSSYTLSNTKDSYIILRREIWKRLSFSRYHHSKQRRVARKMYIKRVVEPTNTVERQAEIDEQHIILEKALNQLPNDQREAIRLRFGFGLDLVQIQANSLNPEILRSRMRRGLKSLSQIPEVRELYSKISA